jgi:hypothetical protein
MVLSKSEARKNGDSAYAQEYNAGLANEDRVLELLSSMFTVEASERLEDIELDIDCYVKGLPGEAPDRWVPVSIKSLHDGEKFGNVYFELLTQRYQPSEWTDNLWSKALDACKKLSGIFINKHQWKPGWFYSGSAEYYVVWQGSQCRLYKKFDVIKFVDTNGWLKVLPLSRARLATQGGKNTICGYLDNEALPFVRSWWLSKSLCADRPDHKVA